MKKQISDKPVFNKVSPELLEVMPYQYKGKRIDINIESEEFTCLCPWSGLPDFAYLNINYVPDTVVVELKSLKYYLQSYRMVGIVHESAVNKILEDLVKTVKPKSMTVELVFNPRGGITTTVKAEYKK
ncbi:MAG: preQ(1) synthase [Elusimicrobia bacterium]|nr:preQ(1) synthase [Elusimicrobiota bacterium]